MGQHILITGGTGFVGSEIAHILYQQKNHITILSRSPQKVDQRYHAVQSLDDLPASAHIDGIINLAGAPINKSWTSEYKKILMDSRIDTTQGLIDLIQRLEKKPSFLISASAIGYYGAQPPTLEITENSTPHDSFAHQLCQSWEEAALKAEDFGVRVALLRLGVVLGHGGILKQLYWPYMCCMGGRIGDGQQGFSWIHLHDLCCIILWLITQPTARGAYNATAPHPVSQNEFRQILGRILHRPAWAHMAAFIVKALFGQMGEELLLEGAKVYPEKLLKEGFSFKYPALDIALKNLFPLTKPEKVGDQ